MRVEVAVRTLEPHRELPALAGMQCRFAAPVVRAGVDGGKTGLIACERNVRGHGRTGSQHPLHVEFEALAALLALRQARHHADELDIAAFPRRRQRLGKAHMRSASGPHEARGQRPDEPAQPLRPVRPPASAPQKQRCDRQRQQPAQAGQHRHLLQHPGARHEHQSERRHGV